MVTAASESGEDTGERTGEDDRLKSNELGDESLLVLASCSIEVKLEPSEVAAAELEMAIVVLARARIDFCLPILVVR